MKRLFNPFDMMRPALEASMMLIEAQQVIALRMAGMAGVWSMAPAENQRMVDEKLAAVSESARAVMAAGLAGKSPGAVAMAGLRPLRRRTRANAKRLRRTATGGDA